MGTLVCDKILIQRLFWLECLLKPSNIFCHANIQVNIACGVILTILVLGDHRQANIYSFIMSSLKYPPGHESTYDLMANDDDRRQAI